MAYNKFTLEKAIDDFKLNLTTWDNPFLDIIPKSPSAWLTETLIESRPLGRSSATEKARSEFIVAPILIELHRLTSRSINIFSGKTFDVDPKRGLKGACDFMVSLNPDAFILRAPLIAIVEAKKGDLDEGLGQCAAEMYAATVFNQQKNESIDTIYGAVTTGETWKFMKLHNQKLSIQTDFTSLEHLNMILGLLLKMVTR
jgi:hypothetical protein